MSEVLWICKHVFPVYYFLSCQRCSESSSHAIHECVKRTCTSCVSSRRSALPLESGLSLLLSLLRPRVTRNPPGPHVSLLKDSIINSLHCAKLLVLMFGFLCTRPSSILSTANQIIVRVLICVSNASDEVCRYGDFDPSALCVFASPSYWEYASLDAESIQSQRINYQARLLSTTTVETTSEMI
jgi:hypothetical protein